MAKLPQEAARTIDLIVDALGILEAHPHIGRPVEQGLRELAIHNLSKARYAARKFVEADIPLRFTGPYFNEFVIQSDAGKETQSRLRDTGIIGGLDLGRYYPELAGATLCCVTETATRKKIDTLVQVTAEQAEAVSAHAGQGKG